jgi:predicted metal-dependent hydrolase
MGKVYGSDKEKIAAGLRSLLRVAYDEGVRPKGMSRDEWRKHRAHGEIGTETLQKVTLWGALREKAEQCLPADGVNVFWPEDFSLRDAYDEIHFVVNDRPRAVKVKAKPVTFRVSEDPIQDLRNAEEHKLLKDQNKKLAEQVKSLQDQIALTLQVADASKEMPVLAERSRTRLGSRQGVAKACLSDLHFEERVKPEQVNYCNEYSPLIARARLDKLAEGVIWKINTHRTGYDITKLIQFLGGDIITGYLHLDNLLTNFMSPFQAVLECKEALIQYLLFILEEAKLEEIEVNCLCGNHGRNTEKEIHKDFVQNSFEWLLYHIMKQQLAGEERIKFNIAKGKFLYTRVYDQVHRELHGTGVGYAGGVGRVTIPLNQAIRGWDALIKADVSWLGHFHTYLPHPYAILNGSVCGFTEYAQAKKCPFEPPQQAFAIIDSHRGLRDVVPLWLDTKWDKDFERKGA